MENSLTQEKIKEIEKKEYRSKVLHLIAVYTFLVIGAICVLFPFYWMINTSLKVLADYNTETVPTFIPTRVTFDNYVTAWQSVNLGRYLLNTVVFSITTTGILVIISILAAFAFARLEFYGKNVVFTLFLATMMIPMELFTITNYATIVNLNLRNSFVGLILPSVMSVFYIYLLRQNFMQVPDQMYYAAKVDNTSDFKYLFRVLVPLSKPTLISIAILKFIECWNSYIWPRLITTNSNYNLVSNGIQEIRSNGFGRENIPAMMAAVVIVSIPLLVLFAVFRKQIMSGVSRSSLKG